MERVLCPQASFLRKGSNVMLKKISFLLAALILVMSAVVFTGCKTDPEDASILGTWVSVYDEIFIISDTEFSSNFGEDTMYAGTIAKIREEDSGSGYITIRYTTCSDPAAVGKYYVIHYKGLGISSVELAGAASQTDPDFDNWGPGGKTSQADAEAAYTVENGYFAGYSACTKQ